jgi:hypothetical protein
MDQLFRSTSWRSASFRYSNFLTSNRRQQDVTMTLLHDDLWHSCNWYCSKRNYIHIHFLHGPSPIYTPIDFCRFSTMRTSKNPIFEGFRRFLVPHLLFLVRMQTAQLYNKTELVHLFRFRMMLFHQAWPIGGWVKAASRKSSVAFAAV